MKQILSFCLAAVLILALLPMTSFAAEAEEPQVVTEDLIEETVCVTEESDSEPLFAEARSATLSLAELQAKFPSGKYWNHYVSEASQTGDNLSNNWNESFANTITDTKCHSHNMSYTVGYFDCNFFDGGIQCCGFARKLGYDAYGSRVTTWPSGGSIYSIKPGDVVTYKGAGANPQHWVFVTAVSGTWITVGECNIGTDLCKIAWGRSFDISTAYDVVVYAAPWSLDNNSSTSASISWNNSTQTPKDTDFYAYTKAQANISGSFAQAGITVWDPLDRVVAEKTETADSNAKTYLEVWYNITEETGAVLSPGVTYHYQFLVVFNGTTYYSPIYEITTTGTHTHSYGAWTTITAASCTKTGTMTRSCTICGAVESKTVEKTAHSYTSQVTAPTCGAQGYTTHTCSVCGDSYVDSYVAATGKHTYSSDTDTTCNVCGYTRTIETKIETVPMYRLYNPNTGEHFYTGSTEERDNLKIAGWNYEGVGWNAPISIGKPVYRMCNPNSGDHHYTMSWEEVGNLKAVGWRYEGVAWNSAPEKHPDSEGQFRLYNPNADLGSHHYTSSETEKNNLVSLGWRLEGIGWYGLTK